MREPTPERVEESHGHTADYPRAQAQLPRPSLRTITIAALALNALVFMPPGKSSLALFTPTEPGTYTFYCQPHADKAAGTGMVGTLIVEP
jgi:plastocyanin